MMKRKTVILVAVLVISFALVNVGFAAWVLSNDMTGTKSGNISAEAVSDKSVMLEINQSTQSINFGKSKDSDSNSWLTPSKETKEENLQISFTLRASKNIRDIKVKFTAEQQDGTTDGFAEAVELELIKAPEYIVSDTSSGRTSQYFYVEKAEEGFDFTLKRTNYDLPVDLNDARAKEAVTLYLTFKFGWGDHFSGKNPYTYYKGLEYESDVESAYTHTGTNAENNIEIITEKQQAKAYEDAFASLYLLNKLVGGLNYNYTFSAKSILEQ